MHICTTLLQQEKTRAKARSRSQAVSVMTRLTTLQAVMSPQSGRESDVVSPDGKRKKDGCC
jgi:hypothetical protein